ncbi:hypothetical protein QQX10_10415 [Demequina sp. SYSU T00039]|uniref:Type II secretion system protein GspF domain-containing protein n=1 Tax=Demequina lignilytica TaxID=3051663 RepID=A0AAW7M9C7_9MICO|nr:MULTISPECIES: type II secretion system F family protein [unclassified Demequina]MDN4478602.1 hypothetical protein [Demequina sp. SYSU T00039-1]MDN4488580.1 hypothetical protein [Demequina sp. SYSU T00039]MDN4491606.1 hypothetical protein [Demequina sp. SYSU T00068]
MTERYDESLPRVVGLLAAGLPDGEAWRRSGATRPAPPWGSPLDRAVAAADALAGRVGAPLGTMLGALADVAADEREAEAARAAALAGPRLSARILAWLPVVGVALGAIIEPAALRVLLLGPLGWTLLALAAALTWTGRLWTRRLVAGAVHARGVDAHEVAVASALLGAALDAGVDLPRALREVGGALEAPALTRAADALAATGRWPGLPDGWSDVGAALAPAWEAGARAGPALAAVRRSAARRARADAATAAGELGVRVALPLTLCLLPAFVLVGLVPLLIAVLRGSALV